MHNLFINIIKLKLEQENNKYSYSYMHDKLKGTHNKVVHLQRMSESYSDTNLAGVGLVGKDNPILATSKFSLSRLHPQRHHILHIYSGTHQLDNLSK
jgi:hypothetical protein